MVLTTVENGDKYVILKSGGLRANLDACFPECESFIDWLTEQVALDNEATLNNKDIYVIGTQVVVQAIRLQGPPTENKG